VVELHPQACQQCQSDLSQMAGQLVKVNQITELPPSSAQVMEVRQYRVACPQCGQAEVAQAPAGLEMERSFGARLEATVVYLRQEQHLSYQRTQETLQALNGVHVSQGGIDHIMQRAGKSALEQVPAIQQQVAESQVVYCDETGDRVDGATWWEWVFCTTQAVLHWVRDNRSVDTIRDVMGQQTAQVWVSDGLPSQLKAPAQARQLCLAHLLRNLQKVVERTPGSWWAKAVQAVLRAAIHLHHRRDTLSPQEFAVQAVRVERVLERLLNRPHPPPEAGYMLRRLRKYRHCLLVCLHRTDVEPTNNVCERALRASVVHRKVTNGFRSEWGARAYAALASVIDTGELSGMNAFHSIQALFGPPALPLPVRRE
jgi:transposase